MNVKEMVIEVKLLTQQMNASNSRKWYDDEISWVLTTMQNRFVRSQLREKKDGSGGFELDQVGVDNISTLIKSGVALRPYILDDTRYKVQLPHDYEYLISDSSKTTNLCGSTAAVSTETLWTTILRQDLTAKSSAKFYETASVVIGSKTISLPTSLPYSNKYVGYSEKEDIAFIAPYIALLGGWYWERLGDIYAPGKYIALSTTDPVTANIITDTATTSNKTITSEVKSYHSATGTLTNNRLIASNKISQFVGTPFWKSSYFSPISELVGNVLYIYRDGSFTVNSALVTYIRKPQPISLSLGTDCELPVGVHKTICDLAVEYIKGTVADQAGTQLKSADIANRVVI